MAVVLPGQQYPFVPLANSPKNIERILQDKQGRLWMSTHDDVLCFDGARFFSLREFGLPAELVTSLAEDQEGGILSASEHGVYRFLQGRLEHVVSDLPVYDIIAVAPGLLLAAVYSNPANPSASTVWLYRIRAANGRWKAERLANWEGGVNLSRNPTGAILTVCPGGWCELPAKLIADWNPGYSGGPVFHGSQQDIQRVVRDRFGCVWFRSIEAGAYQCPGDAGPIRLPAAIAGRNVWSGEVENDDGSMLFANVGSLAVGRPGAFQVATPADGLPPVAVSCAVRARDGTIWLGTIQGLYRFPYPFRMEHWNSRHGLVWSFARNGDRVIAGTSAGVAYLNKDREWTVFQGSRQFGSISSVLPDPQGNIYAVVSREGVIQLSPDGSLAARTPVGQGARGEALARTPDGQVWLAGGGIYGVRKRGSNLSLDPEDLPGDRTSVKGIAVDRRKGELWACSGEGLLHKEAGTWRLIAGLGGSSCLSLVIQANGDVWASYPALGLDHPALATQEGRRIGELGGFFVGLDTRGWVWGGGGKGIYVAESAQAENSVWLHLNEIDGLTDLDANRRSFFSDLDGSVWWAADTSIVHFSPPPDLAHPAGPPPVFLSAFSVNGGAAKLAETFRDFPHGSKLMAHAGSLQIRSAQRASNSLPLAPGAERLARVWGSRPGLGNSGVGSAHARAGKPLQHGAMVGNS